MLLRLEKFSRRFYLMFARKLSILSIKNEVFFHFPNQEIKKPAGFPTGYDTK